MQSPGPRRRGQRVFPSRVPRKPLFKQPDVLLVVLMPSIAHSLRNPGHLFFRDRRTGDANKPSGRPGAAVSVIDATQPLPRFTRLGLAPVFAPACSATA